MEGARAAGAGRGLRRRVLVGISRRRPIPARKHPAWEDRLRDDDRRGASIPRPPDRGAPGAGGEDRRRARDRRRLLRGDPAEHEAPHRRGDRAAAHRLHRRSPRRGGGGRADRVSRRAVARPAVRPAERGSHQRPAPQAVPLGPGRPAGHPCPARPRRDRQPLLDRPRRGRERAGAEHPGHRDLRPVACDQRGPVDDPGLAAGRGRPARPAAVPARPARLRAAGGPLVIPARHGGGGRARDRRRDGAQPGDDPRVRPRGDEDRDVRAAAGALRGCDRPARLLGLARLADPDPRRGADAARGRGPGHVSRSQRRDLGRHARRRLRAARKPRRQRQ